MQLVAKMTAHDLLPPCFVEGKGFSKLTHYTEHPCSLCLSDMGVQAKFTFLGEFWRELTKMSKAEESAAEQRLVNYKARL